MLTAVSSFALDRRATPPPYSDQPILPHQRDSAATSMISPERDPTRRGYYTREVPSGTLAPLTAGQVSPRRPVPASIERPEYVDRPRPKAHTGGDVQTAETIERMRVASRIAAQALRKPGGRSLRA